MSRVTKIIFAGIFLVLSLAASNAATDPFNFDEGTLALARGDYAAALRFLRPLANQGNPSAQFRLGGMYDNGQGVAQVARRHRIVGLKCEGAAEAERGPIGIALPDPDDALVVVRFRVVEAESRCRPQAVERLIEPALLYQRDSQIVGEDPVRGAQR